VGGRERGWKANWVALLGNEIVFSLLRGGVVGKMMAQRRLAGSAQLRR
jgi:hypothetical protein